MASTTTSEKRTAKDPLDVQEASIELMGFTREERDAWEFERNNLMLSLLTQGFSLGCLAKASGYAVSRVSDFIEKAREKRDRA